MAQLFNMPQLGSTMEEGLVALWKRREGEAIQKGDILLEVETDKTIVEVPAPCDGVLRKILAQPETRVPIHQPLAILGLEHEDIAPLLAEWSTDRTDSVVQEADGEQPIAATADAEPDKAAFAISPRARRLAEERSVALALLAGRGTGPGGRVIERDVLAYLEEQLKGDPHPLRVTAVGSISPPAPRQTEIGDEIVLHPTPIVGGEQIGALSELTLGLPGSQIRPMTASLRSSPNLHGQQPPRHDPASAPKQAQRQPPIVGEVASMALEVDMTACLDMYAQLLPAVNKSYSAALDCVHLVVKATASALAMVPQLNAAMMEEGLKSPDQIDIAVFTPVENELVVQMVERADIRTLGAVSAALTGLTDHQSERAAATGQHHFTLVALTDEVDLFYPSLPPGQVAALGLGRIAQRPVASNGQIIARMTMHLCLSYAPARVDTALAARFLQRLKELLEAPALILI
jgi:pyruvate dehydrogenase E2 component (dihydrolipoamide acetyltransferase)